MGSTIAYHVVKHKKNAINGLQRHDERKPGGSHKNKNIDGSRTSKNVFLKADDRTYQQRFEGELEARYKGRRKPRSDAVALVSQTVQFGGDLAERSQEEQIEVLRYCSVWLMDRFGEDNTISSVIHLDETNPHLHISYVPLTSDGRLSAKDFTSRANLRGVQSDLLKAVQTEFPRYGFGRANELDRGFSNGRSQKDFERLKDEKSELEKQAREFSEVVKNTVEQMETVSFKQKKKEAKLRFREKVLEEKEGRFSASVKEKKEVILKSEETLKKSSLELERSRRALMEARSSYEADRAEIEAKESGLAEALIELERLKIEVIELFNRLLQRAKESVLALQKVEEIVEEYSPVTEENFEDLGKDLEKALLLVQIKEEGKEKVLSL